MIASPCAEVQKSAAGLASLPPDDAERKAAHAHARSCGACKQALAEGDALMMTIAQASPLEAPRPEILRRVSATILTELEGQTVGAKRRAPLVGVVASLVAAWALPLALARKSIPASSLPASVAIAALAALTTAAALVWGGPVLALIPLGSVVVSLVTGSGGPLAAETGLHCAGFELALACLPLAAGYLFFGRHGGSQGPSLAFAAAASGGALAAQAVLHIICDAARSHPHLLVFHTGGVLLAAGLGLLAARVLVQRVPIDR